MSRKLLIATALVVAVIFSFFPTPIRADVGDGFSWHSMFTNYEQSLWDIWGTSPSDVFAVGDGVIIHYNGTNWDTMVDNSNYNLNAVWGSSSSNVFAVGAQGLILHYDGSSWQSMNSQVVNNLFDVWGTSASDVFAVGEYGKILHYDGSVWNVNDTNTAYSLQSIWGNSSSNYYIVGINTGEDKSLILHYNGASWQTIDNGTWGNLFGIWGTASNNIFAVGYLGTVLHYDGNSWTPISGGPNMTLTGIWGTSPSDYFVVSQGIVHYNGSTWNTVPGSGTMAFRKIMGFATGEIFAVGFGGNIAYYGNKQLPVFKVTPLRDQFYRSGITDFDAPVGESVMHTAFDFGIDPLVTTNNTDIILTHTNNAFTVYQFITPATGGSPMFTFSPKQPGLTTDNITLSCPYGSITFQLVGNGVPIENPESWIMDLPTGSKAQRLIYDETRNYLYITDFNNNRVIVLSPQQKTIVTTIPVGIEPVDCALSQDRQHLYVTNAGDSSISDVDLNTSSETQRLHIPSIGPFPGYVPYNIAMISNVVALVGSKPPGLASGGPIYQVDFAAKTLTVRSDLGSGRYSVLRSSDDLSTVAILPEPAGSPSTIVRYETATNSIISSSYNRIDREIITNKDGTIIVTTNYDNNAIMSNLRVTDHNLNLTKMIDLITGQPFEPVFHPGGQYIYSLGDFYPVLPYAVEEASLSSNMLARELRFPMPQDYYPFDQPKASVVSNDGTWLYAILVKTWNDPPSKILAVKINRNLTSLVINPANITGIIGSTKQFTAVGTYSDGSTADITTAVTWTSSDPTKTSIAAHTGLAQILAEGSTNVTAALGGVNANATINTLTAKIVFTTTPHTITAGVASGEISLQTENFDETPLNVGVDTIVSLTSSSSSGTFANNPDFAAGHIVTSITVAKNNNSATLYYKDTIAGSPTVTAAASGFSSGTQQETVTAGPLDHITVSPSNPSVGFSGNQTFTALGYDLYNNMVSALTFSWSVSNPSAGSINSSGVFTAGTNPGIYVNAIHATSGGKTGLASVTVVMPGTPTKLVFSTQPSTYNLTGKDLEAQPLITVQDAVGVTVSTYSAPVTIAITPGTGTVGAIISGNVTINAVNGIATFSGMKIDKAGSGYTLTATSGNLTSAVSQVFRVVNSGDANLDGILNMGDVTKVERIILGLDPATCSCDANNDGLINMGDVTKIERFILGLDPQ